jgi:hypothetical protein
LLPDCQSDRNPAGGGVDAKRIWKRLIAHEIKSPPVHRWRAYRENWRLKTAPVHTLTRAVNLGEKVFSRLGHRERGMNSFKQGRFPCALSQITA